jgi:uncharacterized protein (DUF488 family)
MFTRQRALLRLVENEGGQIERLRLVKLAFLLSRDPLNAASSVYDFVPYKRGPFSFMLYYDLRGLARDGWFRESENHIQTACLPSIETSFLESSFLERIDAISNKFRSFSTSELVDSVYLNHPWFTINAESVRKRRAVRPTGDLAVYTVGYEGITVDALLNLLLQNGIRRLIDVRCNPVARRYGFHKSTASRLCADLDIDYVHFPSLGIPSAWRAALSDDESYEVLFRRYEKEVLPRHSPDVTQVASLIKEQPSALMCMEANHQCCHRSRLAAEVSRRVLLPIRELRQCQ